MLLELVTRVRSAFSRMDQEIAQFQLKSGLRCIPGCGRCCTEADVFTTVLEMLPAAHELLRAGAADAWLTRIHHQHARRLCVLYKDGLGSADPGHCTAYQDRPSICRLFGFASVRNRQGEKMLALCREVKSTLPQAAARAVPLAHESLCFPEIGSLMYAQDPVLGSRLVPINQALGEALMRLGLHMQVSQSETLGNTNAA